MLLVAPRAERVRGGGGDPGADRRGRGVELATQARELGAYSGEVCRRACRSRSGRGSVPWRRRRRGSPAAAWKSSPARADEIASRLVDDQELLFDAERQRIRGAPPGRWPAGEHHDYLPTGARSNTHGGSSQSVHRADMDTSSASRREWDRQCAASAARSGSTAVHPAVGAVAAMRDELASRGPDGSGRLGVGPGGARPPPPGDHRPVERRRAADGRRRARADRSSSTAASTTTASCGAELERRRLPVLLHQRHRGDPQGVPPLGRATSSTTSSACSRFAIVERESRSCRARPRPARASSRSISPRSTARCASPRRCRRCRRRRRSTPTIDPVALHHYLTFHAVVPAPRTILAGVQKLPPATVAASSSPTGDRREQPLLAAPHRRDAGALRRLVDARVAGGGADDALAARGRAADGRRRAGRGAAVRRPRLEPDRRGCWPSRASRGSRRSASASRRRRRGGRRVPLVRHDRRAVRRPSTTASAIETERVLDGARRRDRGDERADGEPRPRRLLPAVARRCRRHVKVVQSGQGADEVFAGYHWYQTLSDVDRATASTSTAVFFDRTPEEIAAVADRRWHLDRGRRPGVRRRAIRRQRASTVGRTGAAARHRGDARGGSGEAGRQHDDGVGPGGPGARSSTTSWSSWRSPARPS